MKIFKKLFSKRFFENDIAVALVCALIFTIFLTLAGFEVGCNELRGNVLRLHILANSNSDTDQSIKLEVRDAVLTASEKVFESAKSKEDALNLAKENVGLFKTAAEQKLKQLGVNQSVTVKVEKTYFNTREYENFTLPAGQYDAVRVLLGNAEGKNWWCVMFPSMCIPAAADEHSLTEAVDEKSAEIAENAPKYEIRFKIVEWYESIINWFAS